MNKTKKAFYRRLAIHFSAICLALFLTISAGPMILAQLPPSPAAQSTPLDTLITADVAQAAPQPFLPSLDFTPVMTSYLPMMLNSGVPPEIDGCNPTGGSGGLAPGTYETTVAGLDAIVVVGAGYNPARPTFLGIDVHGDGGSYRLIKSSSNPLNQFANAHGWILVSPLSPNGDSWWHNFVGDHSQRLADVFESMFDDYNVCRDILFGMSGSGGSEFWTGRFFAEKGGLYPVHIVVACGGNDGHDNESRAQIAELGQNPTIVARSSFYYVYGTEDRLVPYIEESIDFYGNAGFKVLVTKLVGAGHCSDWPGENLPMYEEYGATYWGELLEEIELKSRH